MAEVAGKTLDVATTMSEALHCRGKEENGQIMKLQNIENVTEWQQTDIIHKLYEALTC